MCWNRLQEIEGIGQMWEEHPSGYKNVKDEPTPEKNTAFEVFKRHHLWEYSLDCATAFKDENKRIFSGVFGSCFRYHFTI